MTHQQTQLLSRVGSERLGVCVMGLQLDFLLLSSLMPDCLVGSRPPYDSTVESGWVMCHGLITCISKHFAFPPEHLSVLPMSMKTAL